MNIEVTMNKSESRIGAKFVSVCWFLGHKWNQEKKFEGKNLTMIFAEFAVRKKCLRCGLMLDSYRDSHGQPVVWEMRKQRPHNGD